MAITQRGTHAGVIIVRLCHNIMIIKLLDNHNHSIRNKNSTDTIFVAAGTTLNTRLNTESASLAIIGCVIFRLLICKFDANQRVSWAERMKQMKDD